MSTSQITLVNMRRLVAVVFGFGSDRRVGSGFEDDHAEFLAVQQSSNSTTSA